MIGRMQGAVAIVLGALTMVIPTYLLPVCTGLVETRAGTTVPMKCHWVAQSELGAGAVIIMVGLALLLTRTAEGIRLNSLMLGAMAVLSASLPTWLIGMCKDPSMPCRAGTLPGLIIISALTFATGAVGFLLSNRQAEEPGWENA